MKTKAKIKIRYTVALLIVCLLLGFILSWELKSVNSNNQRLAQDTNRADVILSQLNDQKAKNEDITARNSELEKENQKLKQSGDKYAVLAQEIEKYKMIAGLLKVRGNGITVSVSNSDVARVREADILRMVNEIRTADVQAIAINNERVTANTEIRATQGDDAGDYVIINGNKVMQPYMIKAIADPKNLKGALNMLGGVKAELGGFLNINILEAKNLELPAISNIKANLLIPVD